MRGRLTAAAERRFHATPISEDEAQAALEWVADREGKTLSELVEELVGWSAAQKVAPSG
jgi:hypothetical protein